VLFDEGRLSRTAHFEVFDGTGFLLTQPKTKVIPATCAEQTPAAQSHPGLRQWFRVTATFNQVDTAQIGESLPAQARAQMTNGFATNWCTTIPGGNGIWPADGLDAIKQTRACGPKQIISRRQYQPPSPIVVLLLPSMPRNPLNRVFIRESAWASCCPWVIRAAVALLSLWQIGRRRRLNYSTGEVPCCMRPIGRPETKSHLTGLPRRARLKGNCSPGRHPIYYIDDMRAKIGRWQKLSAFLQSFRWAAPGVPRMPNLRPRTAVVCSPVVRGCSKALT